MAELTRVQIDELHEFQRGLTDLEEYLFFRLAWVTGDKNKTAVSFEDKYSIMKRWDEFKEKP